MKIQVFLNLMKFHIIHNYSGYHCLLCFLILVWQITPTVRQSQLDNLMRGPPMGCIRAHLAVATRNFLHSPEVSCYIFTTEFLFNFKVLLKCLCISLPKDIHKCIIFLFSRQFVQSFLQFHGHNTKPLLNACRNVFCWLLVIVSSVKFGRTATCVFNDAEDHKHLTFPSCYKGSGEMTTVEVNEKNSYTRLNKQIKLIFLYQIRKGRQSTFENDTNMFLNKMSLIGLHSW